MAATTTPEAVALLDSALKLSVADREFLARRLRDSLELPPNTFESPEALQAELKRIIEAVENGTMKTYTIEETMEHLRQVAAEGEPQ